MKQYLLIFFLLTTLTALAQKREEYFSYYFKPEKGSPYYYVVTEKKDSLWQRTGYYILKRTQAMEGWYKDEAAKIPHGTFTWFHPNRKIKSTGIFNNGKIDGTHLEWNEQGSLVDSLNFKEGRYAGISMRWYNDGMPKDSISADGAGNSVQVSWYDDGAIASAGRWTRDTVKNGRWKYFHRNGTVLATEDYAGGKQTACLCYDEVGNQLDPLTCKEKKAEPAGGIAGWRRFLEDIMGSLVERKAMAREWTGGEATVVIRFGVEKDGRLAEFTPLTQYGAGIEDEVIRMFRRAPKWTPAWQWGRPVRSYHTQPITIQIASE